MKIIKGIPLVFDDLGMPWYFLKNEGRITPIENDGTWPEGGYFCENIEDGIHYLIEDGYLTIE